MPSLVTSGVQSAVSNLNVSSSSLLFLVIGICLLPVVASAWTASRARRDDVPIVNRRFAWEPQWLSRFRWMFWSESIVEEAYHKYNGKVYRLARGDLDFTVVPSHLVTELNRLPENVLNSRICHVNSMMGWHNGLSVVLETNLHVKTLLSKVSPALPELFHDLSTRISRIIDFEFPGDGDEWQVIEPLSKMAHCTTQAVAFVGVGIPMCDDPRLLSLLRENTLNAFTIMFALRAISRSLHTALVWLLPAKWNLLQVSTKLQDLLMPELHKRRDELPSSPNLTSSMIADAKISDAVSPQILAKLMTALATGGIYSTGNILVSTLIDLVSHPEQLEEIRREIRDKHAEIHGVWDDNALATLYKLDSALKESVRLAPGSLLSYSRAVLQDYTMSNGHTLKKGEFICVNSHGRAVDPSVYPNPREYDALRFYNQDFEYHKSHPFKHSYSEDYRWGSGRWACSGRYLATMTMKTIMVKLLDEYEFKFVDGVRPANKVNFEFVYIDHKLKVMCRRRQKNCGIAF